MGVGGGGCGRDEKTVSDLTSDKERDKQTEVEKQRQSGEWTTD